MKTGTNLQEPKPIITGKNFVYIVWSKGLTKDSTVKAEPNGDQTKESGLDNIKS